MDSRGTSDLVGKHRKRGGVIRQLMERQLDVKELIQGIRDTEDRTVEEGLAGNLGYDDDVVVATVLATKENSKDPEGDISTIDLIWAGAFLDHLDTLGFEVRRKP